MKTSSFVATVALSVVLALGLQNFVLSRPAGQNGAKAETAYDRVMRTGVLHCAYALYPPFLDKDPNTGKLSGVAPDVMSEFEKASGVKVSWGPEIDWGDIAPTLQNGKADAFCAGMFLTPQRGRVIAGSLPLFFSTLEAFARLDDKRFDGNTDRINQPDTRIAVNMGDLSEEVARRSFPLAQRIDKGAMGGEAELFLNVATNKADLALSGPSNLSTYNQANPAAALRKVEFPHPLMTFQSVIGVEIHELALLNLIDATLHNLTDNGMLARILKADTGAGFETAYFPPKPQL